ncbi:MAG: hypothetical protein JNJ83_11110 [Verrucomicrobiaceae bacterium]|nr:hypothetical protein [Verrucomicrobiaceae bacterium]
MKIGVTERVLAKADIRALSGIWLKLEAMERMFPPMAQCTAKQLGQMDRLHQAMGAIAALISDRDVELFLALQKISVLSAVRGGGE